MYKNRFIFLVFIVFSSVCSIRAMNPEGKKATKASQNSDFEPTQTLLLKYLKEEKLAKQFLKLYEENEKQEPDERSKKINKTTEKIYCAAMLKDTALILQTKKQDYINKFNKYQVDPKKIEQVLLVLELFYPSKEELDAANSSWENYACSSIEQIKLRFKALRDFIKWFVSVGYQYKHDYMINKQTLQPIFDRYHFNKDHQQKKILDKLGWWRQDGWVSQIENSPHYYQTIKALAIFTIGTVGITLGIAGFRKFFPDHFSKAYSLIKYPFVWLKPLAKPTVYQNSVTPCKKFTF